MTARESAGVLMFRRQAGALEVLLAHPGGPFWAKKDEGAWTLPKGAVEEGEDRIAAARREFSEETGHSPTGEFVALGSVKQKSGKTVHAWAVEGELDPSRLVSNLCEVEWPPRSGRKIPVPEIDRVEWFGLDAARVKILPAQSPFLDRLVAALAG